MLNHKKIITTICLNIFIGSLLPVTSCSSNNTGSTSGTSGNPGGSATVTAQWAQSLTAGSGATTFYGSAIDSSGNLYVGGMQTGTSSYSYASGVNISGSSSSNNAVLLKYNKSGTAQWVQSVVSGSGSTTFNAVAIDSSGNIYAAGVQSGNGITTYATGITAQGAYSGGTNAVLVKYNSSGVAQWAQTVTAGANASAFNSVAVDSSGNIYAVGYQYGNAAYTYGTGVNPTGPFFGGNNIVLVKYNSSGVAQWAQTVSAGSSISSYLAVAVDSAGNIYAAGSQANIVSYTYAAGVSATGLSVGNNAMLVKYNSAGVAQWVRTQVAGGTGGFQSIFQGLVIDSSDNIICVGYQVTNSTFDFGNSVTTTGSSVYGQNVLIIKYNGSGVPQWAQTNSNGGTNGAQYYSVGLDSAGNIYAAGSQIGLQKYTYAAGVDVTGSSTLSNTLLVKYNSSGTAQAAQVMTGGNYYAYFYALSIDKSSGTPTMAGYQYGNFTYSYGGLNVVGPAASANNSLIVQYKPF